MINHPLKVFIHSSRLVVDQELIDNGTIRIRPVAEP